MKRKDYIIRRVLDLITFRPCIVCGKGVPFEERLNLCSNCAARMHRFGASGTLGGYKFISVLPYKGNVRYAMQRFKFENKKYLGYTFAKLSLNRLREFDWFADIDCIACVPMGKRPRLYNQCAVISSHISDDTGLPFDESAIVKVKDSPPFYTLSKAHRKAAAKDAFSVVKPEFFQGKKVLLIDDIFTTGATIVECAVTIHKAGASDVYCMTACYGDDV